MMLLMRRLASLEPVERKLVVEAMLLLMLAWIGLRFFRLFTLQRVLGSGDAAVSGTESRASHLGATPNRIAWAITVLSRRFPMLDNCLVKAVAADAMLRRRRVASKICLGAHGCRTDGAPFQAHAWVESDGQIVIGALEDLSDYAVLSAKIALQPAVPHHR